jgi:hypothetical protein
MLPAIFVSHGAPTFPLTDAPARAFLEQLAGHLPGQAKRHSRYFRALGKATVHGASTVLNETGLFEGNRIEH